MQTLLKRIKVARGDEPADLVLKGGSIVNVFTRELQTVDVAVADGYIAGIGQYQGIQNLDISGKFIAPGFIDGHIHLESTLLTPPELAKYLIANGTTAVVADPHEIANVLGKKGIRYLLEQSRELPVDFFFMLPSCVPATDMETAGARLTSGDLLELRDDPRILGLAEMMNYPGVVSGAPDMMAKIEAFYTLIKDGHAPLLSGKGLNAYVGCGIRSDHECTELSEALEKLGLGMHIMIREGSQAKNLKALIPLVKASTALQCSLVTDDLHPHDLLSRGHMNHLINRAVSEGLDPITAIVLSSYSTARYFGLSEIGAVAPGYCADMVVLSSLDPLQVDSVIKGGSIVFSDRELRREFFPTAVSTMAGSSPGDVTGTMRIRAYDAGSFVIAAKGDRIRVIGLNPDQLITRHDVTAAPIHGGLVVSDPDRDLIKIAVLERHSATGNIGLGFVDGFGLTKGALASSVAHDSHNIVCVGCSDSDMCAAVRCIEEMKGGMAVIAEGKVLARLPLPIAGLMSDRPLQEVAAHWEDLRHAARQLGCRLPEPFMALSFLALPVIPELKITDRGLFDVRAFRQVGLFVE